jgi:hypothetical protein
MCTTGGAHRNGEDAEADGRWAGSEQRITVDTPAARRYRRSDGASSATPGSAAVHPRSAVTVTQATRA